MKNNNRVFILTELILGALVIIVAVAMLRDNSEKNLDKVSVIIENSDDNQWNAFKYGLRMAAEDQNVEMFVVGTEGVMSAEDQENMVLQEIDNGADAVIVQPVPGNDSESMLNRIKNSIPVMSVGTAVSLNEENSSLPVVEADNFAMGKALAEEILEDYAGKLEGRALGIISETLDTEASANRRDGFESVIEDTGAVISWTIDDFSNPEAGYYLEKQPEADLVIAMDDVSLTAAGKAAAANDLHGAVVYGIGHSTEAVYYVDTGVVECLVVPDEFSIGYYSLAEISESLQHYLYRPEEKIVPYTVLRREELFSEKNQELLFTMNQ